MSEIRDGLVSAGTDLDELTVHAFTLWDVRLAGSGRRRRGLDHRVRPRKDQSLVTIVEPYDVRWFAAVTTDFEDLTHLVGAPNLEAVNVQSVADLRLHEDLPPDGHGIGSPGRRKGVANKAVMVPSMMRAKTLANHLVRACPGLRESITSSARDNEGGQDNCNVSWGTTPAF